ncbi:hypothetical protein N9033_00015 [bacterium]|nr:hypothetical protein [bacterium]
MAQVQKQFEIVGDLILSGDSVRNIFEPLGLVPPVRAITIPGGSVLSGADVTIPSQTLNLSGSQLTLSDGNTVDLADALPEIDIQTISLSNDIVSITRGNTISLEDYKQQLTLSGDTLLISSGNDVDLSPMKQDLSVSGTELSISDGNTVDLGFLAEELDDQTLSLSGTTLTISNGNAIDLATMQQDLTLDGTDLSITDGNTVDLSPMNQSLSISGTNLTITDGNTVDLAFLAEELDNQTLSLSGNTLTISNGNNIDLSTTQPDAISPVFVTNIVNNNGLLQKSYLQGTIPNDYIVTGITVDDDSDIDITVEWDGPTDDWMGEITINDNIITDQYISRIGNTRRFTATVNMDLDGAENIVVSGNGSSHTTTVSLLGQGPAVTNVSFGSIPTYGGQQQSMYLDGDTLEVTLTFDTEDVSSISLDGGNDTATTSVSNMSITPVNVGDGTSTYTFNTSIDTSLSSVTDVPVKISAKNSFGTEGDEHTSIAKVPVRQGPEITNITFGGYPGTQTELKDNDSISITVTFDTNNISNVQLASGGSYASSSQTKNVTVNSLQATTSITIDTSVTSAQDQPIRIRARGGNNNYGNYINSTNTVTVNNVSPTFSGFSVTYPTGQQALKNTDTADVNLTITNVGSSPTYTYSNPRSEVSIPSTNVYSQTKTVTNTNSGNYNISSNNFKVVVNRQENDKTSTYSSGVIKIADVAPSISISVPNSRLRSGGDENTTAQTYQITVTSNQQLDSFNMSAAASAGTLLGSWQGSNSNRTWKRNIQISDSDDKGTFDWSSINATNLAETVKTTADSGGTYTIGGFVERSLTMSALSRTRVFGTDVGDPTKLTITETFRGSITFDNTLADGSSIETDISTGVDVTSKYTIVDSGDPGKVDYGGDAFFYLDRVAVNNNVSGTSVITVEEGV